MTKLQKKLSKMKRNNFDPVLVLHSMRRSDFCHSEKELMRILEEACHLIIHMGQRTVGMHMSIMAMLEAWDKILSEDIEQIKKWHK